MTNRMRKAVILVLRADSFIYTTNAIELINMILRKAIKPSSFPTDESVSKVVYLAI